MNIPTPIDKSNDKEFMKLQGDIDNISGMTKKEISPLIVF